MVPTEAAMGSAMRRHSVGRRGFIRGLFGAGLLAVRGLTFPASRLGAMAAVPGGALEVVQRQPATPADLHRALLAGFDARLLPAGFSVVRLADVTYGRPTLVGAVNVELNGPGYRDMIWYEVYETSEQALAAFEDGELGRRATSGGTDLPGVPPEPIVLATSNRTTVYETFVPEGFVEPAWGVVASTQIGARPWGWTGCSVVAGSVLINSQSMLMAPSRRGNDGDAIALARSALANLRKITGTA